jgi:hypothetical protein
MENNIAKFYSILSLGLSSDKAQAERLIQFDLANKIQAKESMYNLLSRLEEDGLLETVSMEVRLYIIYLMVWLEEYGGLTAQELKRINDQALANLPAINDSIKSIDITPFFQKIDKQFIANIFGDLEKNLHAKDYNLFLLGMNEFFRQTLNQMLKNSQLDISFFACVFDRFFKDLQKEIERQNEMSFTMDDNTLTLTFGQVYRIFLDAFADELFLKRHLVDKRIDHHLKRKILLESNIKISAQLIYRFMQLVIGESPIQKSLNSICEKFAKANEDEAEEIDAELNTKIFLILDELELAIYLQRYDEVNRNQKTLMNEPTYKQVKKLLGSYTMEPHFTRYSIIKFFEFNPLIFLNRIDLATFVREIALICETLRSDRLEVPDGELRFFIDRILQQTRNLKDFARMATIFRANVKNYERHEILHNLIEEARLNNRIASALFSFYLGAMLEVEFGKSIPLPEIEQVANRLGSTFSITRRFSIMQKIREILQKGELDNASLESLLKQDILGLKMQHKINEFELYFTFKQYLKLEKFYPDQVFKNEDERLKKYDQMAKDIIRSAYAKIKKVYKQEFADNPQPKPRFSILVFAENRVTSLIGQELDRRRHDVDIEKTTLDELHSLTDMYVSDSHQAYQEMIKTKKINLADLYIEIQTYSTKISVTMTYLKNFLEDSVKANIPNANFDIMQNIQILFGGIAIHHRENQLNIEQKGFENFVDDAAKNADVYAKLVADSIKGVYGNIEVKDQYGKTRKISDDRFKLEKEAILKLGTKTCSSLLASIVQQDLFKEVYDALTSARNMAKNSNELYAVLEDIKSKSSEILDSAAKYYDYATQK